MKDLPIRPLLSSAFLWVLPVVLKAERNDLSSSGLDTGGHAESDRVFIGPAWKAVAKTTVNLRYDRIARNWRDIAPGTAQSGRRDIIQSTSLGVDWEPRRPVALSASLRGERAGSNLVGARYRDTALAVAVKVIS